MLYAELGLLSVQSFMRSLLCLYGFALGSLIFLAKIMHMS